MTIDVRGVCTLVLVFDMPTSLKFYRDVLGFEVIATNNDDAGDNVVSGTLFGVRQVYDEARSATEWVRDQYRALPAWAQRLQGTCAPDSRWCSPAVPQAYSGNRHAGRKRRRRPHRRPGRSR